MRPDSFPLEWKSMIDAKIALFFLGAPLKKKEGEWWRE